ncbi:hypothetical protein GGR56DRAFT_692570 [Xylariaceae sp. FL0804]|nr:hypothetical protein GGR56DRAFT_692570 [Xylariaceae sp. FL0804]
MSDWASILGVAPTATEHEVTAAYRRLARVHHPDKNMDRQAEATEIFKKCQHEAYYSTHAHQIASEQLRAQAFAREQEASQAFRQARARREGMEQRLARRIALAQARLDRERAQERAEQEAREDAREVAQARELRWRREELGQVARWEKQHAVTEEQKSKTCLHSEFCEKIVFHENFTCAACDRKRHLTASKCPHCSALLCAPCVAVFNAKRLPDDDECEPKATAATDDADVEPAVTSTTPPKKDDEENRVCHNCGEIGHLRFKCPLPKMTRKQKMAWRKQKAGGQQPTTEGKDATAESSRQGAATEGQDEA